MNTQTVSQYRTVLRQMFAQVAGTYQGLETDVTQTNGGEASGGISNAPMHLGDLGTEAYLQELNATLLENEEQLLDEIRGALRRVDAGTFGRCVVCGDELSAERLEAVPYAACCVGCTAAAESADGGARSVNVNRGRPHSFAETLGDRDAQSDDRLADREGERLNPGRAAHQADRFAAGTAGGGTALGGLAGSTAGEGDPLEDDLEAATGNGRFDVESTDGDTEAYAGAAGGAVGGTPAGKRVRGGRVNR